MTTKILTELLTAVLATSRRRARELAGPATGAGFGRLPPASSEPRRGEAGYTLIEVMVVTALTLVVFSAAVITLVVFENQSKQTTSHVTALDTANIGVERIARDVRQATMSSSAPYGLAVSGGGSTLSLYLQERPGGAGSAGLHNVTYACAANPAPSTLDSCTRTDTTCAALPCTPGAPAANVTATTTLATGLTSAQVFAATGAVAAGGPIAAVQVTLAPAITGSTLPAVVQETVVPRNCQIGGC